MKNKDENRIQRVFSKELKKRIVADLIKGNASVASVVREYSVSKTSVYKWLALYAPQREKSVKVVLEADSEGYRSRELQQKLKEAEAALGRKQMEVDFLEKLIQIASTELGIDVKKNFSSEHLSGSISIKGKGGTK